MLKLIALITMVVDHIGLFYNQYFFRIIGRISFPIYCFLICRGITKTKDIKKYSVRILGLAILSQCIFGYIGLGDVFNVLFTYFLFIRFIILIKNDFTIISFILLLFIIYIANRIDYGLYGFVVLTIFYFIKDLRIQLLVFLAINLFFVNIGTVSVIQHISILSLLIINKYDKPKYYEKFKRFNKMFYWLYPLHLI
ncbi:MAG: hypothetical protein IJH34_06330, partial [Romboutsia sp.]|nr:hypothetical protein [Romboutsia sp.]